jgi:endonuclease/exonuclease/phosphatase family metal-dependent hydrolase
MSTTLETYNVNGFVFKRVIAQLGVLIDENRNYIPTFCNQKCIANNRYQGPGIYAYQEVSKEIVDSIFSVPTYGGCSFKRQWSWANTHEQFVKLPGDTYNGIVWSPEFASCGVEFIPNYILDDDALHPIQRLGCRTSNWVMLKNRNTGKEYTIISVHGNGGIKNKKRLQLFRSLFSEIVSKSIVNPIIIGDFNLMPDDLYKMFAEEQYVYNEMFPFQPLEKYIPSVNKYKITNRNYKANFFERIDWALIGKNINVYSEYIPNFDNVPVPIKGQTKKPSDHVWVRYMID